MTALALTPFMGAAALLHSAGWELRRVDIDLVQASAWLEIARHSDGLLVTFVARGGSVTVTREMVERDHAPVGRRGDRFIARRLRMRFIGRQRIDTGVRSGLRWLAHYLDDNAPQREIGSTRGAIALLMGGAA